MTVIYDLIVNRQPSLTTVMTKVLAFDFGASSGRAVVGIYAGNRIALQEVHRFINQPVAVGDRLYWDILRLFHEIKEGLRACAAAGHGDISAIGIDTWGVDVAYLHKDGSLLSNVHHYRDDRTAHVPSYVDALLGEGKIYDYTGIQVMQINTVYQLVATKQQQPYIMDHAHSALFIPDFFNYLLTGERRTEYTIASTSALINPFERTFDVELMNKLGIDPAIMGKLQEPGTVCGTLLPAIAEDCGIAQVPVICTASHDTGSAVAAVPFGEGEQQHTAYISSGTWSLLGMELQSPVINEKAKKYNFTNEGGVFGTTRFLKNIMGLWIVQECRNHWIHEGHHITFAEMEMQAKASTYNGYIDPDADVFFSPGHMPLKIQEYCVSRGYPKPESIGDIVRCVYISLAKRYAEVITSLEDVADTNIDRIRIVGGGIKDKLLCQYTANATQRPVLTGPVEATAMGNIGMQLYALGCIGDLAELRRIIAASSEMGEYLPA